MNQEERLEALKNIRWGLRHIEEKINLNQNQEAFQAIRSVESQIVAIVEATNPKMKTQIINFAANCSDLSAYNETEELANGWLDANPEAEIIDMKSALAADLEWSEHCITLAVRVPVTE